MRAMWWLIKIGMRAATRLRRGLGLEVAPTIVGHLDLDEPRPHARQAPEDQAPMYELAVVYARTFCGRCSAGPLTAGSRCPDCLELLAKVLGELHGDEPGKIAEIARLAREGKI